MTVDRGNEYIESMKCSIYQFSKHTIASWVFETELFDIITKKTEINSKRNPTIINNNRKCTTTSCIVCIVI